MAEIYTQLTLSNPDTALIPGLPNDFWLRIARIFVQTPHSSASAWHVWNYRTINRTFQYAIAQFYLAHYAQRTVFSHDAGASIDNIQVAFTKDWEAAEAMPRNLEDLAEGVGNARGATQILDGKLLKVHEVV